MSDLNFISSYNRNAMCDMGLHTKEGCYMGKHIHINTKGGQCGGTKRENRGATKGGTVFLWLLKGAM